LGAAAPFLFSSSGFARAVLTPREAAHGTAGLSRELRAPRAAAGGAAAPGKEEPSRTSSGFPKNIPAKARNGPAEVAAGPYIRFPPRNFACLLKAAVVRGCGEGGLRDAPSPAGCARPRAAALLCPRVGPSLGLPSGASPTWGAGTDPAGCCLGCSSCLTSCSSHGAQPPALRGPDRLQGYVCSRAQSTSCPWLTLGAAGGCYPLSLSASPCTAAVQCVEAFLHCTLIAA